MVIPVIRKLDINKVPILNKDEISIIAEKCARDFMPEIFSTPQPFNVDSFVEKYLGLNLDYYYLSNDGRYLGMTVFNNTDKVIVYVPEKNEADYISVSSGTIIIDNRITEQNHRYRFTLGHEAGHWIYHKEYYGYNPDQPSLFEDTTTFSPCPKREYRKYSTNKSYWHSADYIEWQADKFAESLLMPESAVRLLMNNCSLLKDSIAKIRLVSDTFNVSKEAASIRLKNLGFIDNQNEVQTSFL